MATLHWLDYLIFVAFLAVSLGIGVYHSVSGGRQRTTQEFLMADRKLKVLPTALSLLASYQSAIMILGNTAEMYNWGIQAWIMKILTTILSSLIAERLLVPWIFPLKLTSTYEYFALRFHSRAVAMLAAAIGIIEANLYMGVAIYAPSVALEAAYGISVHISMPLMSCVCVIYTILGGMKAVVWTDVFQFLIMMIGLLVILIKGLVDVGGFGEVFRLAKQENRLNFINLSTDFTERHTLWGFLFGDVPSFAVMFGLHQASVQRYSATKTLKDARLILLSNAPATILMSSFANLIGLVVLAYFAKIQCDPMENGDVTSGNQILVHFVNIIFNSVKGFSGLFLVTLYGGALSTISSSLSGSAASTWESVIKFWNPHMKDSKATVINKVLVFVYGIVATSVAFLASQMPGPVSQISGTFGGAAGGPLIGLFVLGGMFPFVEWRGALAGGFAGLCMNLWVGIGSRLTPGVNHPLPPVSTSNCTNSTNSTDMVTHIFNSTMPTPEHFAPQGLQKLYSISYLWYAPLGLVTCVSVAVIVSVVLRLVSSEPVSQPEKKYLIPWKAACTFSQMPAEENVAQLECSYELAGKEDTDKTQKEL